MIKEYDPSEDNAKTRAKKRRDELNNRDKVIEIDRTQFPDDPTPWKGKSSDFFILHTPRKGTYKLLNNNQKDFILIYYPDTVADPVSLMEFLYRQAKQHEEKEKIIDKEKEGLMVIGRQKQKKIKKKQKAQYVTELVHINQEVKYRTDTSQNHVSFESLLSDSNMNVKMSD